MCIRVCVCVCARVFKLMFYVSFFRPTFRRIIRSKSTEQFSGLPYIYALLNCLICLWYGTPIISPGIILVFTVNSVGAVFQLAYILIFIVYAERTKKVSRPFYYPLNCVIISFGSFCLPSYVFDKSLVCEIDSFYRSSTWKFFLL